MLTLTQLDLMAQTLRDMYVAHEISADEYAARSEDIKVLEQKARR